jgi:hypothetical protein
MCKPIDLHIRKSRANIVEQPRKKTMYNASICELSTKQTEKFNGELAHVVKWLDTKLVGADSYHKIWRETKRTGGAYASFQKGSAGLYLVQIVSQDIAR